LLLDKFVSFHLHFRQ